MGADTVAIIPARYRSTRLPGKALALIGDRPMICHVAERTRRARGLGGVIVATDDERIRDAVRATGGEVVMTRVDHPSGTDRLAEVARALAADVVVNVQGDLPTVDPEDIRAALMPLADPKVDIATLAAVITDPAERTNPNVVKALGTRVGPNRLHATTFTRADAAGPGPHYHHIGLYAYRRAALERFVALPPSPNELRERLEQLRALDAGMRIDVAIVQSVPLGVDTPEDLEKARAMLGG